jgi:hypothetical protein
MFLIEYLLEEVLDGRFGNTQLFSQFNIRNAGIAVNITCGYWRRCGDGCLGGFVKVRYRRPTDR